MRRYLRRLIALAALVAVALVAYLIVSGNVGSGHHHRSARAPVVHRRHDARRPHRRPRPQFYAVRPGDTLSAIAGRTGVSIEQLTALNPRLTPPYALQTGQRLRLRR